jgi:hypothetical protein
MSSSEQLARLTYYADLSTAVLGVIVLVLSFTSVVRRGPSEGVAKRLGVLRICAVLMIVFGGAGALLHT